MGRLVVVVLVLVALAFLVNKFIINGGDQPPADVVARAEKELAAKQAENVQGAQTADDEPNVEEAVENEDDPQLEPAKATEVEKAAEAAVVAEQAAATEQPETILLGTDELYVGIPGEGDLTIDQVQTWLADPKNHVTLKPELPLGLNAGAASITGLKENPFTRAKIELGRQLFFDPRLSSDNTVSCASCHHPDFGYGKDTQFGVGVDGQQGNRNSPTAYNRILSDLQFWDGRAETLEEQAKGPIANPIEMANTHEATIADLKTVPEYVLQFEAVFGDGQGDDAVEINNAAKAMAAFERALVTGPTPWDIHKEIQSLEEGYEIEEEYLDELKEEEPEVYEQYMALLEDAKAKPLSDSARRGGELFFNAKTGCTQCHLGANFTDEKYHNLGVGLLADEPDLGRFVVTKKDADSGAFKTPTIRNVAQTAPYMHDGSQKTLEEVVEWYAKGGHPNDHLSDKIKKLKLTDQEKQDLVNFMKEGLTGDLPKIEQERLPAGAERAEESAAEEKEAA